MLITVLNLSIINHNLLKPMIVSELTFLIVLNLTNKSYYEKTIVRFNSLESKPQKGSIDVFIVCLWDYECAAQAARGCYRC